MLDVLELIVEFLIEASDEVGEDEWFSTFISEVLRQVLFWEVLLGQVLDDVSVFSQVSGVNESISIDSLGLVTPKLDKGVWGLDGLSSGLENTLEDVGQVSDVELVVEVLGSLSEGSLNLSVKSQGSLDDLWNKFLDSSVEFTEVLDQVSRVNGDQRSIGWEGNGKHPEVSLESLVDIE